MRTRSGSCVKGSAVHGTRYTVNGTSDIPAVGPDPEATQILSTMRQPPRCGAPLSAVCRPDALRPAAAAPRLDSKTSLSLAHWGGSGRQGVAGKGGGGSGGHLDTARVRLAARDHCQHVPRHLELTVAVAAPAHRPPARRRNPARVPPARAHRLQRPPRRRRPAVGGAPPAHHAPRHPRPGCRRRAAGRAADGARVGRAHRDAEEGAGGGGGLAAARVAEAVERPVLAHGARGAAAQAHLPQMAPALGRMSGGASCGRAAAAVTRTSNADGPSAHLTSPSTAAQLPL